MDCLVQQRAGWEPEQFFDKDELRATGIGAPSFAQVNKSYRYDNALNTIETKDKGEQLYFTLNKNNQITTVHNQNREQERYAYDSCGYLTQQAQAEYGFTRDELNPEYSQQRLIQHNDIYQQGHKLNRLNHHYYTYDNAGRLTEKTEIRDGFRQKTTYYRWNANNQLTGITNDKGEVWYYKYDALGRRTSKACPQQRLRIEYLWDGDQLAYTQTFKNGKPHSQRHSVFNDWQLLAQQDSYQHIKQTIDGNLVEWRLETGYAICQPNGQVLALLNPKGRTLWRKEKQTLWGLCFANEYKQPNPLDPQLLFAGQWVDEESGLVYNRFRYYDPQSGNYLTSDPIGLAGGERPFGYVGNPIDWVDLFGLAGCSKYLDKWGKGKDGFKNFWDNSSYDEFMEAWSNKSFRDNIKTRLRGGGLTTGGGYHEWLPVSQADKFKQMGVSFDDYMKWKTPTNRTGFLDNLGRYGSHTTYNGGVSKASAQAHKELIGLAKKSKSISAYQKAVRSWANDRLPFGIFDLPF